jgi:hypothetical protein
MFLVIELKNLFAFSEKVFILMNEKLLSKSTANILYIETTNVNIAS